MQINQENDDGLMSDYTVCNSFKRCKMSETWKELFETIEEMLMNNKIR
jgi:hypothetical protein